MTDYVRVDFIFSYWIFLWYILYMLKIVNFNPLLALIIGLIINIFQLIIKLVYKHSLKSIISFCIINTFIKVIPIITIFNNKIFFYKDLITLLIVFTVYVFWMILNKKIKISKEDIIKENKNKVMPFEYLFTKFLPL